MSPALDGLADGYVDADGDCIHYVEQGRGSPLLLIHGAFRSGAEFLATEFGAFLSQRYRVIAPDSLAHGKSDAPSDPARYSARKRALHLVAVLDALNIERAHVVGYSMGGWMASALATFFPERVASLTIGGWDVVNGMYTPAEIWGLRKITGEMLIAMTRKDRPEILTWLQPAREPALGAAIDGMNDLEGLADGVSRILAPIALWSGQKDLYYDAVVRFADAHGLPVIALPGDHISTLYEHGATAAQRVSNFLEGRNFEEGHSPAVGLSHQK